LDKLVTASVVLFENEESQVRKVIESLLKSKMLHTLYLIDNSSESKLSSLSHIANNIEYIFNNKNLGYGKAHNIAIKKSIKSGCLYHIIVNPDIYFNKGVIESLFNYMELNTDIGHLMPKVLYPDGEIQYLCKLLPTPFDLIIRRFSPFKKNIERKKEKYELKFTSYLKVMDIPNLSGCFMFLRNEIFNQVGMFDEKYFMYLEDIDLTRRINERYRTVYYPKCEIYHNFEKASYYRKKLLIYHIKSAIRYFNKWGWFFDKKRKDINEKTLLELGEK